ncbi:MAG: chlorophyll synthesis pathway protein BchC [Alsobacter sp.]
MHATAVILREPEHLMLGEVALVPPGADDIVVDVAWSGISTGTERLLYDGRMPPFPGMGYPLVPGYEAVGRVAEAGDASGRRVGETVFVPGSRGFEGVNGLFGASASRLVLPGHRAVPVDAQLGERGVLLALAATAFHAVISGPLPELIVGHGVLGRLIARIAVALDGQPTVWERNPARREGADGYEVVDADRDPRRNYRTICEASGSAGLLDDLVMRLARGGEIVLAGFYEERLSFAFPAAFMKEARLRIAAEFAPGDVQAVIRLVDEGRLSLDGLVTHRRPAVDASEAYRTAFGDPACLKMVLDWSARP